MTLAQGSVELLDEPTAGRLLGSTDIAWLAIMHSPAPPLEVLRLRGPARPGKDSGMVEKYSPAHGRRYGEQQDRTTMQPMHSAGMRKLCIVVRPTWGGAPHFRTRVPGGRS